MSGIGQVAETPVGFCRSLIVLVPETPAAFWITARSAFHGTAGVATHWRLINRVSRMIQNRSRRVSACAT